MPDWIEDELASLRQYGLYRRRRRLEPVPGVRVRWRGRELVSFASNDYLNLAMDPRLARAAARAAQRYGCGAGSSPLVSGYLPPLRRLERALAHWEGTQAVLVFSSGYVANLAAVTSLAGAGDAIFSDALNHASLIDGCRLSRASVHVYRHADANHLHDLLRHHGATARRRLIVTDSIFSMDGDMAPVMDLHDLARRHDCMILIDEAHATGVLGDNGRGLLELASPIDKSDGDRIIKIGTLSKALGAQGGFICGSKPLITWLVNRARPYIFSTALAPPAAAAARRGVALAQDEPERRRRLLDLAALLRDQLRSLDVSPGPSQCHIVPIVVGEATAAVQLSKALERHGLLVPAIRPPSVPEGTARLRISLTAAHTEADIRRLAEALRGGTHAHR